jgi:hypothetical protein
LRANNDLIARTSEKMQQITLNINATKATIPIAGQWRICSHPKLASTMLIERWA